MWEIIDFYRTFVVSLKKGHLKWKITYLGLRCPYQTGLPNLRNEYNYFLWFLKQYATLFLKNIRNKRHRKRDFLFMSNVSYIWRSVNDYNVVHLILSLLDLKFCIDEAIFSPSRIIYHIICLIFKGFSPK